jgi:hypothetical protein
VASRERILGAGTSLEHGLWLGLRLGLGLGLSIALFVAGCRTASGDAPLEVATVDASPGGSAEPGNRNEASVASAGDSRPDSSASDAPAAPPREFEVPAGWESLTDLAFERAVDAWLPRGEHRRAGDGTLVDLRRALGGGDIPAMRAAVLLARTRDPRAAEALLDRLEEREAPPPGRPGRDAADVVAAAAFAEGLGRGDAAARLNALANGRRAHPSTAVRVECARSALALGRDESIPFLLSVLRIGTHAGRIVGAEEDLDDLAWCQVRAAEALAARAGTPNRFRPEASVTAREEETTRLESLLPSRKKR